MKSRRTMRRAIVGVAAFLAAGLGCESSSTVNWFGDDDGGSSEDAATGGTSSSASGGSSDGSTGNTSSSGSRSGSSSGSSSGNATSSGSGGRRGTDSGASSSGSAPGTDSDSGATSGSGSGSGSGSSSGSSSDGGSTGRKFAGNISTQGQIRSDFATYWNQFTPENEGKWGSVQGSVPSNNFNWQTLDAEYKYCQSNNILFKEHNFIWGNQQPGGNVQPSDVQNWMNAFCQRYPNVKLIDVVNEPLHTPAPYRNNIGGSGSSGWDWVVNALQWARAACPNAILIVNDFNTIEYQADHDNFVSLVKAVKAAGGPIDAVGAQGHAVYGLSTSTVQNFIDDMATKTGLPLYVTEYDINLSNDTQQSQVMQSQFTMFWNDGNVKGITIWGYIEGTTWEPNTGLMTSGGAMRPAMTWLVNFLKTH